MGCYWSSVTDLYVSKFGYILSDGELDETIPYHVHQQVCDVIPQIEFHSIQKAKHLPHYEQSDEVNEILLKFLQKN